MKKTCSLILLVLLLTSMLGASIHIGTVEAAGTVYIRADGSIDPPTTPISSTNNVTYTFESNITDSIVVQKSNITIDGNWYTLQGAGSGNGFYLFGIDNVTIERTNIKDFDYGICLDSSSHNTLTENSISAGFYGYGILLGNSAGFNDVIRNNVTDNKYGIVLHESSILNSLAENDISNNEIGIWLQKSDFNSISRNSISNNHCGIYLEQTVHNNISHNSLSNNSLQAQSDEISTSIWDGGYPSGGNYWSDCNGTDLFNGPYQNVSGSDGIGDAPYVIDGSNADGYPLMGPWAPPDVAATNLTASKSIVGLGYATRINGTVMNHGSKVEGFNVSIFSNSTLIDSPYVVLTMQNSTTMSLSWNTTGFSYGNYTLSEYIEPLPEEADVSNNDFTGGTVLVTIPGDINGDFKVSSSDLNTLLVAFGGRADGGGQRTYNSDCDFDNDGYVGSRDINTLLVHYGQHYNESEHPPLALAEQIDSMLDAINWDYNESPSYMTVHAGEVFNRVSGTRWESLMQYYSTLTSIPNRPAPAWQEILRAKRLAELDGYTSPTIDSYVLQALTNIQMLGHVPFTFNGPYYLIYDRGLTHAYRYAQQLNHETAKWDKLQAFQEIASIVGANGANTYIGYNPLDGQFVSYYRYYDDASETCNFLLELYYQGVSPALGYALAIWDRQQERFWNGEYYGYSSKSLMECEDGFFALVAAELYEANGKSLDGFPDRVLSDMHAKLLVRGWNSPLWDRDGTCVMTHTSSNPQKRLGNTIGGVAALHAYYPILPAEDQAMFRNMISGTGGQPKPWQKYLQSGLYDDSTKRSKMRSGDPYSDYATAQAAMLLFLEGIIPESGSLAIPLNDERYEDTDSIFPARMFRFDYDAAKIMIPVNAGTLRFQFGTTASSYTFDNTGVYEVQFSSDWNRVISTEYIGPLDSSLLYLTG